MSSSLVCFKRFTLHVRIYLKRNYTSMYRPRESPYFSMRWLKMLYIPSRKAFNSFKLIDIPLLNSILILLLDTSTYFFYLFLLFDTSTYFFYLFLLLISSTYFFYLIPLLISSTYFFYLFLLLISSI